MCGKILRPGFGCTNIGDTSRPRPIGHIHFMRGHIRVSIGALPRQIIDKTAHSSSSIAMKIVSPLAFLLVPVSLGVLTGCETTGGGGTAYRGGRAYHVV